MAVSKSSEIPEDAVKFASEAEAASYIWDIVHRWDSLSQTWALRYGPVILGGINAACGLTINKHYRTKFKLGNFGQFASGLPVFVMPALLTTLFHNYLISTDMLLMKSTPCPVCYEVKSAVIQCAFGLAYPMMLAPTSALLFASRYGTYRVPEIMDGPKVIFKFLGKYTKSLNGKLVYMAAIQVAASSIITYFEMKNNYTLAHEIQKIEEKVDSLKKSLKN